MNAHRRAMRSKMKRPKVPTEGGDRARRRDHGEYDGVIQQASREINSFKGDGSFMDAFCAKDHVDGASEAGEEKKKKDSKPVPIEVGAGERNEKTRNGTAHVPRSFGMPGDGAERPALSAGGNNASAAAMLRARLSGVQSGGFKPECSSMQREVRLPMVDGTGKAAPGAFGRETAAEVYRGSDEGAVDLETMVRRVKHGTEENVNDVIARNIARNAHFREVDADDEYDFDAGTDVLRAQRVSRRGKKDAHAELARKEKARQIQDFRRMSKVENSCRLCLDKNTSNAHLTISISPCAYLTLPSRGRLVPGHCCIVPAAHIASSRLADEATWEEMRNFKKCVLQMHQSKGMDCIFFETALDVKSPMPKHHARVECIPVSPGIMAKAPMYFKKAIEDATSDWSQHASKGCIETESRHLQKKIPPNFEYVHIEFGLANGFVSVIDNPRDFDKSFCRRVLLGLLENNGEKVGTKMHGRGSREGPEVQKSWAREFKAEFSAFDWTS